MGLKSLAKNNGVILGALLFISIVIHFAGIWYPSEAVFDEVHFGKFVEGYLKGEYYFDIHPPLGKLAVAAIAEFTGFGPDYTFESIGQGYPDAKYIWLRFLPAFFGSLLVPLVYLLALRLSRSKLAAGIAGFFVLFENALLVQSKFILLDSFLLFFGFLALYLFLESKAFFEQGKWGWFAIIGAAVSAGISLSVKWTGVVFLSLILLFGAALIIKKLVDKKILRAVLKAYAVFLILPAALYIFFFFIHFKLLPNSGPGNAFMNERFQLSQKAGFPLRDFPRNFIDLNKEMFAANQRLTATHSYSSKWYTWPIMGRSIYYWAHETQNLPGLAASYNRIYLLGNPFVWWLSTALTIYFFSQLIWETIKRRLFKLDFKEYFLATAYIFNIFPFIFISRVMFLYHYLAALIFSIMIAAIVFERMARRQKIPVLALFILVIAGFLIIAPVSFGFPLSQPWPRYIFWLPTWI